MISKDQFFKALAIILAILALLSGLSYAQSVKLDASGNYVALKSTRHIDTIKNNTGKTYTDSKGIKYPVYITATDKLYVIRVSKNTGKSYKYYLRL